MILLTQTHQIIMYDVFKVQYTCIKINVFIIFDQISNRHIIKTIKINRNLLHLLYFMLR